MPELRSVPSIWRAPFKIVNNSVFRLFPAQDAADLTENGLKSPAPSGRRIARARAMGRRLKDKPDVFWPFLGVFTRAMQQML